RLKDGVTLAAAQADMATVATRLVEQFPNSRRVDTVLVPMKEDLLGDTRLELTILMAAAAAVLLIACANLASLLLSRATGRRGELAVRAALGATRARLVRQMLVEAGIVSIAGGLAGVALAPAAVGVIAQLTPRGFVEQP